MDHRRTTNCCAPRWRPASPPAAGCWPRGSALPAPTPGSGASCSCCCAARWMVWPRCRRWAIRTMRGCAVSWICRRPRSCIVSMTCSRCIRRSNFMADLWQRQAAGGGACGGHALSRALAFRCAGCAGERRGDAAWLAVRLAESRAGRRCRRQRAGRNAGVALGANVPLAMRGPTEVASWSPGTLPDLDDDTLPRIGADVRRRQPAVAAPGRSAGRR